MTIEAKAAPPNSQNSLNHPPTCHRSQVAVKAALTVHAVTRMQQSQK
jgi:hypothetical protein